VAEFYTLGNFTIDDIVLHDGRSWIDCAGGNAIYAALGAQPWIERVGLIARVGNDLAPHVVTKLQALNVELHLVPVDAPNIHNWALYEPDGTRQFVNHRRSGTNDMLSVRGAEIPPTCFDASAFHIAPMPIERQAELVNTLRDAPAKHLVGLDPHEWWIEGHESLVFALARRVDFFMPSQEEARRLFGKDDPASAVRALGQLSARAAVVKLGADGSLVYDAASRTVTHVPIYPAVPVDVTGAGDAYCGGFVAGYLKTRDVVESACYGTVSASFCVETLGVLPERRPSPQEAQERLTFVRANLSNE